MPYDVPREERAREAAELHSRGLNSRQIGMAMGISRSYAAELVADPTGKKVRERKKRYGGICEDCGAPTDGSNGREKAPRRCWTCATAVTAQHGSRTMYQRGCSCDSCREANRVAAAAWRESRRGMEPPEHGASAYVNWGCRCPVCTREHREYIYGYVMRWQRRKRAA